MTEIDTRTGSTRELATRRRGYTMPKFTGWMFTSERAADSLFGWHYVMAQEFIDGEPIGKPQRVEPPYESEAEAERAARGMMGV